MIFDRTQKCLSRATLLHKEPHLNKAHWHHKLSCYPKGVVLTGAKKWQMITKQEARFGLRFQAY